MVLLTMHSDEKKYSAEQRLASFDSFLRCGPALGGAFRLNGTDQPVGFISESINWDHITRGRPVQDCRISGPALSELVPSPRSVLKALAEAAPAPNQRSGMRLG